MSELFEALQDWNSEFKLSEQSEGVMVETEDFQDVLLFLQQNRHLHRGMDGTGLIRFKK